MSKASEQPTQAQLLHSLKLLVESGLDKDGYNLLHNGHLPDLARAIRLGLSFDRNVVRIALGLPAILGATHTFPFGSMQVNIKDLERFDVKLVIGKNLPADVENVRESVGGHPEWNIPQEGKVRTFEVLPKGLTRAEAYGKIRQLDARPCTSRELFDIPTMDIAETNKLLRGCPGWGGSFVAVGNFVLSKKGKPEFLTITHGGGNEWTVDCTERQEIKSWQHVVVFSDKK
ncbi:MAG TPA: hypothetical protein VGE35_01890 [Candidatus Paceibacterota bacterium]